MGKDGGSITLQKFATFATQDIKELSNSQIISDTQKYSNKRIENFVL